MCLHVFGVRMHLGRLKMILLGTHFGALETPLKMYQKRVPKKSNFGHVGVPVWIQF